MGTVFLPGGQGGPQDHTRMDQGALHPFFSTRTQKQKIISNDNILPEHASTPEFLSDCEKLEEEVIHAAACHAGQQPKRHLPDSGTDAGEEDAEGEANGRAKPRKIRRKRAAQGADIQGFFAKIKDAGPRAESPIADAISGDVAKELKLSNSDLSDACNATKVAVKEASVTTETDFQLLTPQRKRVLRLNKNTGTLTSPPKSKDDTSDLVRKHRGLVAPHSGSRRRPENARRVIKLKYGPCEQKRLLVGRAIESIMSQPLDRPIVPVTTVAKTHPLFRAKQVPGSRASPEASKNAESTSNKIYMSTPCSPRKARLPPTPTSTQLPPFGVRSMGPRVAGARLAPWPQKDMSHVRGQESNVEQIGSVAWQARKLKGLRSRVAAQESILMHFLRSLDIKQVIADIRSIDSDSFLPPPPELRQPSRRFESGIKLRRRIADQLTVSRPDQDSRLARLYGLVAKEPSALDKSECEQLSWTQKYSPISAAEVLQPGKEPGLLRDWLRALTVMSVDTGITKSEADPPRKKKRRKARHDDFIVESDEEADILDELPDDDCDLLSASQSSGKRTVVRNGNASTSSGRLTNAVVISGPHGSGKTSAVHAIAKELDFEVFELHAGSRRSGKDILEKIGDMTRNHLVQHQNEDTPENTAIDQEDVANEIKSGKQATMNSFFKSSDSRKPVKAANTLTKVVSRGETKKDTPRKQKQSLILLDEVDILYEEDKQFWATIISLMSQSKRPFVMTCTNEDLVPLDILNLHGIFRFVAPQREASIDRLLLIAACEGHNLRRDAVASLFAVRDQDLRGTLMDLQFWCQIGVGDRKGGFDWFQLRWPKGVDLDEYGDVIRVVSDNTYQQGMEWTCRRPEGHGPTFWQAEAAYLRDAWCHEAVVADETWRSFEACQWPKSISNTAPNMTSRMMALDAYDNFIDAVSAADMTSCRVLASSSREELDHTLPFSTAKAQEDYILGYQMLDAPLESTYDELSASMYFTQASLARHVLEETQTIMCMPQHFSLQPYALPANSISTLTRHDFSQALDSIAVSDKPALTSTTNTITTSMEASVLDGAFSPIVLDIAPYVRSIVAYDAQLQQQRLKVSNLLSEGGTRKMRKTRAAYSALEGGPRSTTRRERWFKNEGVNGRLVARTGGEHWGSLLQKADDCVENGLGNGKEQEGDTLTSGSLSASETDSIGPVIGKKRKLVGGGLARKSLVVAESEDEITM